MNEIKVQNKILDIFSHSKFIPFLLCHEDVRHLR